MPIHYEDYGYTLSQVEAVTQGTFRFDPDMPVSKKSRFGDGVWDWADDQNSRLKLVTRGRLRVNWDRVTLEREGHHQTKAQAPGQGFLPALPMEMIEDIKRALFIYGMFPTLAATHGTPHPKKILTIVNHARVAINFFFHIYKRSRVLGGSARIRKLSDITLSDIRQALGTYPYRFDQVKRTLRLFATEFIRLNLKYGELQWTRLDLRNIRWPEDKVTEPIGTLPDRLFKRLSDRSRDLVGDFLYMMGIELRDPQAGQTTRKARYEQWPRFRDMFERYVNMREVIRAKGRRFYGSERDRFVSEFGLMLGTFVGFLFDVHCAAQTLILLYTGMRYSEAASLQTGCLVQRDGIHLIKSTLIKGKPTNWPIDDDEWVAIDLVQDAVRALEELSRCTFNRFLFASFHIVKAGAEERPITDSRLIDRLNLYLDRVDVEGQWSGWELSTHQFRHGLIAQLARAEVGIPYITRQLHHHHSQLAQASYQIHPVSMTYGRQKERLLGNATGLNALKEAKLKIVRDMYGEGRQFGGGGAALHVERTEAFFKGQGLEGKAREAYVEKLAESGVVLIRTGFGFCTRNHADPSKFKESPPPCIGDFQCNPFACEHSVVPESQKPNVIKIYQHAVKQSAAPDQAYLKGHWEAMRKSTGAMLVQLGIDPKDL